MIAQTELKLDCNDVSNVQAQPPSPRAKKNKVDAYE